MEFQLVIHTFHSSKFIPTLIIPICSQSALARTSHHPVRSAKIRDISRRVLIPFSMCAEMVLSLQTSISLWRLHPTPTPACSTEAVRPTVRLQFHPRGGKMCRNSEPPTFRQCRKINILMLRAATFVTLIRTIINTCFDDCARSKCFR